MTVNLINYSIDPEYIEAGTQGSYGIEKLTVVPDKTWDGLDLYVVFFMHNDTLIKISLPEDNTVEIPQEITLKGGEYKFAVVGVNSDVQKVSVSGTLVVTPSDSFELLEIPIDKISPAFADFILLYHEMNEIADRMKVELFFDDKSNSVCWRYSGTDEKHILMPTEKLSLSARFEGTNLVVTTPAGELSPVNLKGSSWYCGKAVFNPSQSVDSIYIVNTDSLTDSELEVFENINTGDMYVSSLNGDIYRCTSPHSLNGEVLFERACSVSEFVGEKRIDMGVTPNPEARFYAQTDAVVYLDNNGSDSNSGSTPDSPVQTFSTAISKLPADGGSICIVEKYTQNGITGITHDGRIMLCGLTPESIFETGNFAIGFDLSIANLTIIPSSIVTFISVGENSLALLSGITSLPNVNSNFCISLECGGNTTVENGKSAVISIFSGSYAYIYAGGSATTNHDGIIEIYGNNVSFFRLFMGCIGNSEMNANAYCIMNNVTNNIGEPLFPTIPAIESFCVNVSGGYCFYDRNKEKFMLYSPAKALVTTESGESYIASPGVISITENMDMESIVEWDFSLCKEAIVSLGMDCAIHLKNAPVGTTGTITVTDGLIDNYPKQGLNRERAHIYTVSITSSGEVWTCREA